MINLKKSKFHVHWNIVAGILLLIVAFFILVSDNEANSQDNFSSNTEAALAETNTVISTEEPVDNVYPEASVPKENNITEPESTENTATEPETTENPKDLINYDAKFPYLIRINRDENFAVVYGMDKDGHHSIPYKVFICSTGLNEADTPLGVFEMSDKYRWRQMVDGTYAQYAIRINGQIMLHSVPYLEPSNDTLEYWEYNKLGQPASLGCIRFRVAAIKWIYDNCKKGTRVNIYSNPGEVPPIETQKIKKLKKSNPKSHWDPTDPDKDNPWKKKKSNKKSKNK